MLNMSGNIKLSKYWLSTANTRTDNTSTANTSTANTSTVNTSTANTSTANTSISLMMYILSNSYDLIRLSYLTSPDKQQQQCRCFQLTRPHDVIPITLS